MSPLTTPPLTLCPPALVPHMGEQITPMCKQPRENPVFSEQNHNTAPTEAIS